jgi:hypothetical protein
MVGNKHELLLWRTKRLVLAGNSRLVILWKVIASCIGLACNCYQTPDMYSRFSGENKQIIKTETNSFYNFFLNGLPDWSITVCEGMIWYWKLHTLQHTGLWFGNKWTSSASVYIVCCAYKQKCDLQYCSRSLWKLQYSAIVKFIITVLSQLNC